jgi:putative nucleotidyltransferase with HDIG domain
MVAFPLNGVRGAILVVNRAAGEFGSPEAKLVRSIAGSSAVFIENHRLYLELRRMMLDLVRALVSSVEAKDPYTCGHSERVAAVSREIARRMGLGPDEVERAYLAGLLHDIGKIGTPESILHKQGPLTPEEWTVVRLHPEIGGRILAGITQLQAVREAVLRHHEHVDGRGYPGGLRGNEIPPLARIVSVADGFDAMTSTRPYRPSMPLDRVRREIETQSAIHFDAQVAAVLLGMDLSQVLKEFAERPSAAVTLGVSN